MEKRIKNCIECREPITWKAIRCPSCANSLRNRGKKNPMYGKPNKWGHHTEEAKKRCGVRDEKQLLWKGEYAGIGSIHTWVKKRKPKTNYCEKCKKKLKRLELSNNSGRYLRDIKDYEWLCVSCHRKKDRSNLFCPKCKIRKKYKHSSYCKECTSEYNQERYRRNQWYKKELKVIKGVKNGS